MSMEKMEWLNYFTLQSRDAWHTDEQLQKLWNQPTVYDGPIPVEEVARRLFSWEPLEAEITAIHSESGLVIPDPSRKAIVRPPGALDMPELGKVDQGAIMGIFKQGYQPHSYRPWLLDNVAYILDDSNELGIYAAGLLRDGAQAFVTVSVPDTITGPGGVAFKPFIVCVTSFDGSLATTYKPSVTAAVCDNTMSAALGEVGKSYKLKHTKNSAVKLTDARDALGIVYSTADNFGAEVEGLLNIKVSDLEFDRFLEEISPMHGDDGEIKQGRGLTMAENKQIELRGLWRNSDMVAPWKNTAWGVVQAVNTHAHHYQTVRGKSRDERNMQMTVNGDWDVLDKSTLDTLTGILAAA